MQTGIIAAALVGLIGLTVRAEEVTPEQLLKSSGIPGGVAVHVGCGDGQQTLKMRMGETWVVHGLDRDASDVEATRAIIAAAGAYGPVSVSHWTGAGLPFIDNMVNVLVIEDGADLEPAEIQRVLCPRGKAYVRNGGKWQTTEKAWPENIDGWPHALYDASGNAVSKDMVAGPPERLQWTAGPKWTRHHESMSSFQIMVSDRGRVFYLMDEGPSVSLFLPSDWQLVARDAFNGKILWKRKFKHWVSRFYEYKAGPMEMTRRIVADGDRLYVAANLDEGVTVLDSATGEDLAAYPHTAACEEILLHKGILYLVTSDEPRLFKGGHAFSNVWRGSTTGQSQWIRAVEAETGKELWKLQTPVAPQAFAVSDYGVFFHDGEQLRALDLRSGRERFSIPVSLASFIPTSFHPTLVVYKNVVMFWGGDERSNQDIGKRGEKKVGAFGKLHKNAVLNLGDFTALSAVDGKTLWTYTMPPRINCFKCPKDLLVVDDLVWFGAIGYHDSGGEWEGRNVYTGEVEREHNEPWEDLSWGGHQRCHRTKANQKYIIPGRAGIEFISPETGWVEYNHWIRGACLYGTLPANGLLYQPQHPCGCFMEVMLHGLNALAPAAEAAPPPEKKPLITGPAYGKVISDQSSVVRPNEWPTFRHDVARSCSSKAALPAELKVNWKADVGSNLSAMTVAEGKVFLAQKDKHLLHSLDANSGEEVWRYRADGRIDSPPTVAGGYVLFGSRDGSMYCLRAADGRLVWRRRLAPADQLLLAKEQLESVRPLHGSPLVISSPSVNAGKPVVYGVAGRSAFVDGGLRFVCMDVATGSIVHEALVDDTDPATGESIQNKIEWPNMPPANPDILSYNGNAIFMRTQRFELDGTRSNILALNNAKNQAGPDAHLFVNGGFLDDTGFHRIYMLYGQTHTGGAGGNHHAAKYTPGGKMLAFNDTHVFGFSRLPHLHKWVRPLEWHLYRTDKPVAATGNSRRAASKTGEKDKSEVAFKPSLTIHVKPGQEGRLEELHGSLNSTAVKYHWSNFDPDLYVTSMVLTDQCLFVAGPPAVRNDDTQEALDRWQGKKGGLLWCLNTDDGSRLSELKLPSPTVYEGMAAAYDKLFVALKDGSVVCLE